MRTWNPQGQKQAGLSEGAEPLAKNQAEATTCLLDSFLISGEKFQTHSLEDMFSKGLASIWSQRVHVNLGFACACVLVRCCVKVHILGSAHRNQSFFT